MSRSVYLHIPFCARKCSYCDFNSFEAPEIPPAEYVELLLEEIGTITAGTAPLPAPTLYFGGGTPSLLSPLQIARLIDAVRSGCGLAAAAEVTLEANPGTITLESLQGYLAAGVNRLSLGVQSLDDAGLRLLGRIHTAAEARGAFALAREAGFGNIGIDLMHSLPGQTAVDWRATLQAAVALGPEHISAYGLTIEERTPFGAMVARGEMPLADEDLSAEMFALTVEVLQQAGYEHYEISNFARPGFRSRHNQVYWQRSEYIGIGAGAHSFLRTPDYGIRWENPAGLRDYAAQVRHSGGERELTRLSRREAMAEFFFLGLRMTEGGDLERFAAEFGVTAEEVFPGAIGQLEKNGLIERDGAMVRLTKRGLLLANRVMAEFV